MASVPMASRPGGLVGVLNVHTRERREFSDSDVRLLTSIGSLVAGAMHQGRLHRQLAAREQAAERFAEQVIAAQEAERGRLAARHPRRDHPAAGEPHVPSRRRGRSRRRGDAVGGGASCTIARDLAGPDAGRGARGHRGAAPPVLDDLGLADGLASLARSVAQLAVQVDVADCDLSEHIQIALFRIAQESLQNIVKHANATKAHIRLQCDAEHAVLWVTDNGRGFERAAAGAARHRRRPDR